VRHNGSVLPRVELLADKASLIRGRDYFNRGRVLRFSTRPDGTVEGVVEGEHFYRVRLGTRSWDCDCPMGVAGVFCKHCVAVALAAGAPVDGQSSEPRTLAISELPDLGEAQKAILAAFRTRRDLHNWRAAYEYADDARAAAEQLGEAAKIWGAAPLIPTVQKAIAATARVLLHADDSSGVIGGVVDDLLSLHVMLCTADPPGPKKLVDWLINFQFDGKQDFFTPDVASYVEALGEPGLNQFEARLREIEDRLAPPTDQFDSARRLVQHNFRRLAVARRDPQELIDTFPDVSRAYQLHDLAKALREIDSIDLAITYAHKGGALDLGWQAEKCAHYWCELLDQYRPPTEATDARLTVFEAWPTSSNALALARALGDAWPSVAESAYARLRERSVRDLIETLLGLELRDRAWITAQGQLLEASLWDRLVASREKSDPSSVIPVMLELLAGELEIADARNYKLAVKRLKRLRALMAAGGRDEDFSPLVADLREQHKRRPRFLEELRRARF
jgi:hypothetical protein